MKVPGFLVLAILVATPTVGGAISQSGQEVVIEGSKNPELFPEWFTWELAFVWVSEHSDDGPVPLQKEIGISETDRAVLEEQTRAFRELRAATATRIRDAIDKADAQKKSQDERNAATERISLEYRYKILDFGQRTTEQLSAEGVRLVRTWIAKLVRGSTMRLRGRSIQSSNTTIAFPDAKMRLTVGCRHSCRPLTTAIHVESTTMMRQSVPTLHKASILHCATGSHLHTCVGALRQSSRRANCDARSAAEGDSYGGRLSADCES